MKPFLHLWILFFFSFGSILNGQNKTIQLTGLVVDKANLPIPYAAIGIPSKYIGTASTEDGTFSLLLSPQNLDDTLEISSIGFQTFTIKVQDYINRNSKTIILEEDIVSLDEVNILASVDYVKNAVKNVKNNTINKPHQLNMLYRRFSTELDKSRFLVEHYIKVLDRGPIDPNFMRAEVVEGRKSADYRFIKDKFPGHQVLITAGRNPLRQGINRNAFNWKKIGDTSYDGEDVVIIEGSDKKNKWRKITLYIGIDSFGVYKVESTDLNSVWVYRKTGDGKLVLSYHNREWKKDLPINSMQKTLLRTTSNKVKVSYRHEAFVLGVETDKKKIKVGNYEGYKKDMGDLEVNYNAEFWTTISLPPETAFYKTSVEELESVYGVPLEKQFQLVNN